MKLIHSAATIRAYQTALRLFDQWCCDVEEKPFPASPELIVRYIRTRALAGVGDSAINRDLSAISYRHVSEGLLSPVSHASVALCRRELPKKPPKQKKPLTDGLLSKLTGSIPNNLRGIRDIAMISVQQAASLRRSELVALRREDVVFNERGASITIRRSKTDQDGQGRILGIGHHSAARLRRWLDAAGIADGPVFRSISKGGRLADRCLSAQSVNTILKARVADVGEDPAQYAGESARAGKASDMAVQGASLAEICSVTRHSLVAAMRGPAVYLRSRP